MSISFIWVIYVNPMFRNIDDGIKFCIYLGVDIVFIILDFVGILRNKVHVFTIFCSDYVDLW